MTLNFRFLLLIIFLFIYSAGFSQKNFGTWIELELNKEIVNDVEISFVPEIRFDENFSVDEYIFEGKLGYEPFKFVGFAGSYRYNTEIKNKGNEITHRIAFDITGKTDFNRFDASLRARFTNDSDGDELRSFYFRPRVKLSYNIKGSKLEPYTSYELFANLKESNLFKQRFDFGAQRKLGDFHRIGIYYRLQDYFSDKTSQNILGIDYRFKF
ncbi:MAG: DUF2490 domain-containing protein [Prolixibacteraceae bacterium]|nr:DUF2490 domain-containing protein [Prolixibacteraceae bacterium]